MSHLSNVRVASRTELARNKLAQLTGVSESSLHGPKFEVALRQFQESVGLPSRYGAGPRTLRALDRALADKVAREAPPITQALRVPQVPAQTRLLADSIVQDRSSGLPSRTQSLAMLRELYGNRSYNVGRFQRIVGMPITGRLDNDTRGKIAEVYSGAISSPEEAVRKGLATVSASSGAPFRAIVTQRLAKLSGRPESNFRGAEFTRAVETFQGLAGERPDGVVGANTMKAFDIFAPLNATTRTQGNHNISVGADAVVGAEAYLKQVIASKRFFDPLVYDLDPNTPTNPAGVLALQGLLKTVGYDRPMTPGVFDTEMGEYIKSIQVGLVKQGRLTPYSTVHGEPIQLPPCGSECGVFPGRVGQDTFNALVAMAKAKGGRA